MSSVEFKVDREFKALIPPLSPEELSGLKANLIAWGGTREPLVVWDGLLLDGHNRHAICTSHELKFTTCIPKEKIASRDDAKLWIIRNQLGRRNLPAHVRISLAEAMHEITAERAKENQRVSPGRKGSPILGNLIDEPVDTIAAVAKTAGVSTGTVSKARKVNAKAPRAIKNLLAAGELSIDQAHKATVQMEKMPADERSAVVARIERGSAPTDAIRDTKREAIKANLDDVQAVEAKAATGVYDVIVLDPPWPMAKIERDERPAQSAFDYPTMSEAALAAHHVPCAADAHVWVWTTHKFLPMALRLLDAWGLKYVCTFVWHKPGGMQVVGLPQYNCEFAIYARKGAPSFIDTKAFNTCFEAPRGKHSEKPEAFYDVVRRVTGGRRLDMFNRRRIDGFDGWGKEAADAAE